MQLTFEAAAFYGLCYENNIHTHYGDFFKVFTYNSDTYVSLI